MTQYNEYFNRQIQLWGDDKQNSLKNKKIAIIGSGGLGCSLGIALGSSGIGVIDIVDFDTVGVHNIHRQIAFKIGDEGRYKADVLKELIESRCSYTSVNSFILDFESYSKQDIDFASYDLIIDATDNLQVRSKIDDFSKSISKPWLYGSVEAFHGQVCFFDKSSFKSVFNVSDHKPAGIAAPIVLNIASLQANIALRYLLGLSIKKDFLYYCFFNDDGEYVTQKFGLPTV
ncbi:MAG: ThiF family adenylyltransferase [Campylobacterota bacterium]|nr:ThiF family adenylyltransferase [Campylobacterota bacterium]